MSLGNPLSTAAHHLYLCPGGRERALRALPTSTPWPSAMLMLRVYLLILLLIGGGGVGVGAGQHSTFKSQVQEAGRPSSTSPCQGEKAEVPGQKGWEVKESIQESSCFGFS